MPVHYKYTALFLLLIVTHQVYTSPVEHNSKKVYTIGFYSNNSTIKFKQFKSTQAYLNQHFPDKHFILINYQSYHNIHSALLQQKTDFIIVDAIDYLRLNKSLKLKRIAGLHEKYANHPLTQKAITIFTRKTNHQINSLDTLRQKKLAVSGINQSETWWIFRSMLAHKGIQPFQDMRSFRNINNPLSLIHEVLSGKSDAGVIQAGLLESLAKENQLDLEAIKIINPAINPDYAYKHSSKLYPLTVFAAAEKTPARLFHSLSMTLQGMALENSPQLRYGWSPPADLMMTVELLKQIKHSNLNTEKLSIYAVLDNSYLWLIISLILAATVALMFYKYQRMLQQYILSQRDNRKLQNLQHTLTTNDEQTKLTSRTALDTSLEQEWWRACRDKKPVSAIIIDIKTSAGWSDDPATLKAVAQCIRATFKRSIDIKARYGKNEFVIILPDTSLAESRKLAKKLMDNLHYQMTQNCPPHQQPPEMHFGVAAVIPDQGSVPESLIAAADQSLSLYNDGSEPFINSIETLH